MLGLIQQIPNTCGRRKDQRQEPVMDFVANLRPLDFDQPGGLVESFVQGCCRISVRGLAEPAFFVKAGHRLLFGILDVEQFVEFGDLKYFQHVR